MKKEMIRCLHEENASKNNPKPLIMSQILRVGAEKLLLALVVFLSFFFSFFKMVKKFMLLVKLKSSTLHENPIRT